MIGCQTWLLSLLLSVIHYRKICRVHGWCALVQKIINNNGVETEMFIENVQVLVKIGGHDTVSNACFNVVKPPGRVVEPNISLEIKYCFNVP